MDAASRAEEIVQRVEQLDYVSPNSILYNSLIDCVVKSRRRDNASHAEEILRRMEHMHRAGNSNVKPNAYAYRYDLANGLSHTAAVDIISCVLIYMRKGSLMRLPTAGAIQLQSLLGLEAIHPSP